MRSPRSNSDTTGFGYTSTAEGESSKSGEKMNITGKKSKPTCHFCSKKGNTTNVCRIRKANQ